MKFATSTGEILVYTVEYDDGEMVAVMDTEGAYQSATYLDDRCYDLVFDYHRAYDHLFDSGATFETFLMLGGGGYAYPEHIISTRPDAKVDVVELEPMVTMIAKRYFYLERLFAEYDLYENGRLEIYHQDARAYIDGCEKRYDVIVNDCFVGRNPVMSLATRQAVSRLHQILAPDGVYMSNVISAIEGPDSTFLMSVVKTLSTEFAHVWVIPASPRDPSTRGNNIVIATDGRYSFDGALEVAPGDDIEIFQDMSAKMYEDIFRIEDE